MTELIGVVTVKGLPSTMIYRDNQCYRIVENRKSKDGKIYVVENEVREKDVRVLWDVLKKCERNRQYKYAYVVRALIEYLQIHTIENAPIEMMITAFNGGKYRAKYYFPQYFFPMKILEAYNLVEYNGKGGIIVLEQFAQWEKDLQWTI